MSSSGKPRDAKAKLPRVDSQWLAIEALTFFGRDPAQAQRFFAWSGLDAETLRAAVEAPGFALGVADYFVQNLSSLECFAAETGLDPAQVLRLHESLRPPDLSAHDDL